MIHNLNKRREYRLDRQRIIFLISSFFPAIGNVVFIFLLTTGLEKYIYSYNIATLIAGIGAHAGLPLVLTLFQYKNVLLYYWLITALVFLTTYLLFGIFVASIVAMIIVIFGFELMTVRAGRLDQVLIFRLIFMITAFAPIFITDQNAVIFRLAVPLLVALVANTLVLRSNNFPKTKLSLNQSAFVALVIVNLLWVYIAPLVLISEADKGYLKALYLATTILPMVYFKVQDMIFKFDVILIENRDNSVNLYLSYMAGIVFIGYFILGMLLYIFNILDVGPILIFEFATSLAIAANLVLIKIVLKQSADENVRI